MADIQKAGETPAAPGVIYDIARARRRTTARAAALPDDAVIGDQARELSHAAAVVEAAPEVRTFRVAQLRAEIQKGTYQPDAREIARQILSRGL